MTPLLFTNTDFLATAYCKTIQEHGRHAPHIFAVAAHILGGPAPFGQTADLTEELTVEDGHRPEELPEPPPVEELEGIPTRDPPPVHPATTTKKYMHVLGEVHMPYVLLGDSGLEAFLRRVPYMRPFLMKMHVRWSNFSRALSRVLRYGVGPGTYPYRAGAPGHGELSQHNRAGLPFRSFLITAADEFHPANKYADYFDCIYDEDNHAHLRDSASRQDVERCFYEIAMPDDLNAPPMTLTPANADLVYDVNASAVRNAIMDFEQRYADIHEQFRHAEYGNFTFDPFYNEFGAAIFSREPQARALLHGWLEQFVYNHATVDAATRRPITFTSREAYRAVQIVDVLPLRHSLGDPDNDSLLRQIPHIYIGHGPHGAPVDPGVARVHLDPRLDGKIKLVGTDEYIRRNPGIARKPFVRPFVVWSTDFKDLRTNEPTGLARFGHIQGVVFKPSGSNRPPRRSPTGTETTGTSDGDDSSSDSGGSTAESVAPSETPSAGTPSLASRVQSSAFAPHGLLGPLTRQHTYTIAYNDLTNPRTSTDLTMGCWLLYSGRGPDYERITSARHRAFEDPEFAASYHLYDWSPLQRSHQLNAHAILETLHEIENFRWDFTTSQGLSADLAFTRALFTRAAFILNSIGLAAWDVVLHNDFRSHDAQRTRFYERHVLQRDTRLRHAWPQLVKYLRASLSRHREAIPFRSPGEPGYRPAERRDGAAGTEVDAINEIHYGWPSNRHLIKLANADCKPILGVGYFSATMRNHRPPLRLSAAPCRARPFAATDVLMNVHRRTTTRKRPRLKRTAPLPPASVISGSTPCTPYEQSYLASLRVCAARMLGFDDVEDPLDVPLFGDGGPSVPHPIARMTDTNRTLRERINDGRICVNLHIAAIDHRRQVLQYLLTKALVDTGAAADVLDGSIADKLPGLRYSNAPRVHLTGFGTDMTAYARIAFIAIKVGPVTIPRKVLVVAPGLMGNTPMLLGLTTLVALNAHIVLDPANWGMTITSPDSSDGERFHVPFRLRASTTAAFWSDWRRTSLYGRICNPHRRPVRLRAGTVIAETEFGTWPESEFRPHENVETYPKGCYSSWTPQQQLTFPISSVAAQIYENFKPVVVPRRSQPRRYISRARRLYPEVYHRRPPEPNCKEGEAAHVGSVDAAADIPLSHEASERLMSYVARVVTPYTARTGDHFNDKELMELASFFEPHFARFDSEPMLVGPAVGPTVPIASVNADARMEPPSSDTAPPTKPSPETIKAMVDALLKPSESNPDALPEDRTQLQNLLTQRQHSGAPTAYLS
eukprot:tig00021326_g20295.t2